MPPDDRYLRLPVTHDRRVDRVFTPFDDDVLKLILSRAFLLADDASIGDRTIRAQLDES